MEFRNLTPFDGLCFKALDSEGDEYPVVVVKVGYNLIPGDTPGEFIAQVIDAEPINLCMGDEYWGDTGHSSVKRESDLAPFKPKCDVIINGNAYAPKGEATERWGAKLKVSSTQKTLLEKTVKVSGPSQFKPQLLRGWSRTKPTSVTSVPLRWEYAFGGSSLVPNPDDPEQPLLNEVCFTNPLGSGWREARYKKQAKQAKLEVSHVITAPQLEANDGSVDQPCIASHPQGQLEAPEMAAAAAAYSYSPVGLGIVARAWTPRVQLAGTYDANWLEHRHPLSPHDLDTGYWNGAPEDQQIDYPPLDFTLELWNLTAPRYTPEGYAKVKLPGHRPFLLLRMADGALYPSPMLTDTVIVNTDTLQMELTHRISFSGELDIRVVELRFETDPEAPLLTFDTGATA